MSDPTTRDPAASLARCIELAAKATPGRLTAELGEAYNIRAEHGGILAQIHHLRGRHGMGGRVPSDEAAANAEAIAAAVNFLRDDAPALLAEVADLREKLQATQEQADRFHARAESYRKDAEAAEQVAREAREAITNARDWFEAQAKAISKGCGSSWDLMQVREQRDLLDTFLAHHGARTGESNER